MHTQTFHTGPDKTPRSIKFLLLITLFTSLLWTVFTRFFPQFSLHYLAPVFMLSKSALTKGYLWQLFTYPFVQPIFGSVSFNYILDLGFKLYLMWVFGSSLIELKGEKSFMKLFFSGIIFSGAVTAASMNLLEFSAPYMGSHSAIYVILVSWMMLNPYAKVYLFFTIPLNVSIVVLGVWSVNLFLSLMELNLPTFFAYLSSGLYGYLYSVIFYQAYSPFLLLRSFESIIQNKKWFRKKRKASVYDFKTGQKLPDDEVFMDAMLDKIAKKGRSSLTKDELERMDKIAKKR